MYRATWTVTAILMTTEAGATNPNTAMSGIPMKSSLVGLRTAMVTGAGSDRGAGRGLIIRLGVSLLSTMDAGRSSARGGAGARVRISVLRFMVLPLWASSA